MGSGLSSPLPVLSLPLAFAGCTAPPTVFENTILTAAAAAPVLLALVPAAVFVVTRNVAKTLRLLSAPSLWAGVMNSVIWVFFAFIATKRIDCMELILAYPIILALDFTSLLTLYGHYENRGSFFLSLIVLSCLGFVFYAIKFEFFLPQSWETDLGLVGLLLLLLSHGWLILDTKGGGLLEYAIAVLNIVPPGFLNMATCYIILKKHPEQQFIAYSGLIGFGFAIVEFLLLSFKAVHKFFGGNNGPPALPPGLQNVEALAQRAEASAAQAAAAEERVEARAHQIEELLAHLQEVEQQQQRNAENNGDGLRGILVERTLGGQLETNTAQDLLSGLQEEGYDLEDSNGTMNSKKDLPITKLSKELAAPCGRLETNELDKKTTQQYVESGSCDGDDDGKKTEIGKSESTQSVSSDGDDGGAKTEMGESESSTSESGGESKGSRTPGGSCAPTPRGLPQKFLTGYRPHTWPQRIRETWTQRFRGNSLIC